MKLKSTLLIAAIITIVIITSCGKTKQAKKEKPVQLTTQLNSAVQAHQAFIFSRSVGKLFPADTGAAWVGSYNRLHREYAGSSPCLFNATDLAMILKYANCIGISFTNVKINNQWALLAYGVDANATVIKTDSVLSTSGYVSWAKAETMKQTYSLNSLPGSINSEFFGSDLFDQLLNDQGITTLLVRKGINANGESMILSNAYSSGTPVGEDGCTCPPNCLNEPGVK